MTFRKFLDGNTLGHDQGFLIGQGQSIFQQLDNFTFQYDLLEVRCCSQDNKSMHKFVFKPWFYTKNGQSTNLLK